ncbi:MAG: helix-turn-helix domain-containing protein [Reyranellaceae bacterium]
MEQLRAWRIGLPEGSRTLEAAGQLLGVSPVQLSRYETGARRVPPERVPHFSKVTGIAPQILCPEVFGQLPDGAGDAPAEAGSAAPPPATGPAADSSEEREAAA